jgi:hypothetical protein
MGRIDDLLLVEQAGELPPDMQADLDLLREAGEAPPPLPRSAASGTPGNVEQPAENEPGFLRKAAAFGVRVGAPVVGGIAGFASPIPGGAALGAAAGGAGGEYLAQKILGEETDPLEIGIAGVTSAIPAGPAARIAGTVGTTVLRQAGIHAVEGATQGALAETIHSVVKEGELPELANVGKAAAGGAVLGGAIGGGVAKYSKPAADATRRAMFNGAEEAEQTAARETEQLSLFPEHAGPESTARPFQRTVGLAGEIPPTEPMPAERVPELANEYVERVFADMPDEARAELKKTYEAMPELLQEQTRGTQPIERTRALAREISLDPDEIVPPGTAANAEQLAATTNLVSTLHARVRQVRAQLDADPGNRALEAELRTAHRRYVNTAVSLAGFRSEAGRSLRIQREALGEITPAARGARFSAQALKHGATVDEITAALDRAGDDPVRQYNELLNIARSDWKTKAHSYYVMNLLTNPKTWERNLFGNAIRSIEDPLLRPVAGGIDAVASAVTGRERKVYAGEGWQMVLGAKKSLPDAWAAMLQVLKQGFSDQQAINQATSGKFDVRPEPFSGGAKNPFNLVTRGLEATDQFFTILNQGMQRDALAFAQATKLARKELADGTIEQAELQARIADHAADLSRQYAQEPPTEVVEQAARSVFREDNAFAKWINGAEQLPLPARAAIKFMLPFVKTPANIIKQGFEHSPAGFATEGARAGNRTARFRQAEAALGSVILGGGAWAALNGFLAPSAPDDPGKREAFYARYPVPNSVYIPAYGWVPYSDLGPLGTGLGVVADFMQGWQDADVEPDAGDVQELMTHTANALQATGSGLFERSFLTGMADFMELMRNQDPKAAQRFVQNRVVSLVPFQGLGRFVTQIEDPVVRETKTLGQKVQSIVPPSAGALGVPTSADLPARLDAFGKPIERPVSGAAAAFSLAGAPARESDAVRAELSKYGIEPTPSKATGELKVGSTKVKLTPEQDHALREAKGLVRRSNLERAIGSETYANATPEVQERILKRQMSRSQDKISDRAKFLLKKGGDFTVEQLTRGLVAESATPAPEASKPEQASEPAAPPPAPPTNQLIDDVASVLGLDPRFLAAVVEQESGGNPNALAPKTPHSGGQRATGLMQILPSTFAGLAPEVEALTGRPASVKNPIDNMLAGAIMYRQLLAEHGGDVATAARYYHGGPDTRIHGEKTRAYGRAVEAIYRRNVGA